MTEHENSGQEQAVERYANIVDVTPEEPSPAQEAPKAEEPKEDAKQEAKPEDGKTEGEEPRKKGGFIKKLEQKDARIAELERQLAEKPAEKAPELVEPKLDDYETYEDYYKAVARYEAKKELSEKAEADKAKAREDAVRTEKQDNERNFSAKVHEFAKTVPDFEDAVGNSEAPWNPILDQAVKESEMGPELMYHMAKNPDVAEELVGLSYGQVLKKLARLEVQIESQKKPEVKTTQAPPPIKPVGKSANTATYDPYAAKGADDDHEAYMQWRRSQKR